MQSKQERNYIFDAAVYMKDPEFMHKVHIILNFRSL
jgi:hypothetical protein